jgi:hypothetical protein
LTSASVVALVSMATPRSPERVLPSITVLEWASAWP